MVESLYKQAVDLLKHLIEIQSFSREEKVASDFLYHYFLKRGSQVERIGNNLVLKGHNWVDEKPVLLLNSHVDTVRPSKKWTLDPFKPVVEKGKLFGLGSNDAGGPLVCLIQTFFGLSEKEQPYNLMLVVSAEEEISGAGGFSSVIDKIPHVDFAVVGEPTLMEMAIAEKGLMVMDCVATGVSGHAAREEGVNAIYKSMKDIEWFRTFSFPKGSDILGPVKMSVTQIEAGTQHNVVPDRCSFVVDVRSNEKYTNQQIFEIVKEQVECEVIPRSFRLNSSFTPMDHPFVKKGKTLGLNHYGSPTTSDQSVMPYVTVKIGPGDSARSHSSNEFIYLHELEQGISIYLKLLDGLII